MTYTTHLLGGVAASLFLASALGVSDEMTYAAIAGGAAIGSLLPDIDHRKSKISNRNIGTQLTSSVVSLFFSHRGVIHTPIFIAFLGALILPASVAFADQYWFANYTALGVLAGMISHLVMDTLNPGGIMWLFPLSRRRIHLARIKTSSMAEKTFAGAFAAYIAYFFVGESISNIWF